MTKRGAHSNSGAWREGIFKCKHWSNVSGAGSRLDPVTEQNGGPGWCAAILGAKYFEYACHVPLLSRNKQFRPPWQQNDLQRSPVFVCRKNSQQIMNNEVHNSAFPRTQCDSKVPQSQLNILLITENSFKDRHLRSHIPVTFIIIFKLEK